MCSGVSGTGGKAQEMSTRSALLHGKRRVGGPLREGSVVDRDVVTAEQGQGKGVTGGRDAAAAVGDHAVRGEGARPREVRAERFVGKIGVGLGVDERAGRYIAGARDVPEAT